MPSESSIRVLAIDHVVLRTSKLDAMLQFYCELLNCAVERTLPDLGLVQLRAGNALIDLVPIDKEQDTDSTWPNVGNMEHLCLRIADMNEQVLVQILRQQNIKVPEFAERYGAEGFGRSVYITDPESNVVELKLTLCPNET